MLKLAFFSDLHNSVYYLPKIMNSIEILTKDSGLDALALVGDIVYHDTKVLAKPESYALLNSNEFYTKMRNEGKLIFAMGNHEFTLGMHEEEVTALAKRTFIEETGLVPEMDNVINGYHFITAGPYDYAGTPNKEIEDFIVEKVSAALEEDNEKPVFVLTHFPIDRTLCGTQNAHCYSEEFREFIINKPRVIVISGHYHFPNSDPRTITQVENGSTFVYTSCIMGGNGLSLPTSTERHSEYPCQGFMLLVDEETNVVTVKPFYAHETNPEYLENVEFVMDIPAMIKGEKGAYKYTDARAEKSAKPYFANGSAIKLEATSDIDASIIFPAALAGDESLDSTVVYYDIAVYDKKTNEFLKKHRIISDFFLSKKRDFYPYTVFELTPNTEYVFKVSPLTAWYVEGDSIEIELKTKEPRFFDVPLSEENVISKGIFESVITGSHTAYKSANLIHVGGGWNCSAEHSVSFTESGTYRVFLKASAKGAVTLGIKVKNNNALVLDDFFIVNTGYIHTYKDIIAADVEIKEAGDYTVELSLTNAEHTIGLQEITIKKHI